MPSNPQFWLDHDEELRLLEAYLFRSPTPVAVEDVVRDLAGIEPFPALVSEPELERLLDALVEQYSYYDSALRILKTSLGTYQMRLKDAYYVPVRKFTWGRDLTRKQTQTLASIAYKQPVTLRDLRQFQRRVYRRDLRVLVEKGFITSEVNGKDEVFRTTPKFVEYFDLPAEPARQKEILAETLGIQASA